MMRDKVLYQSTYMASSLEIQIGYCDQYRHTCISPASTIDCGTPSFGGSVAVESFSSTTIGSDIFYKCQSGHLLEERRNLVCGGDGMWSPDPQGLCMGKY